MRVLLVGEYSNVHWTLAEGLRSLGHEVTVVSDGDRWKNYPRDIDLRRRSLGRIDTLRYLFDLWRIWPRLRGYDVVQLINPVFLDLRAERILPYYKQLRKRNGKMFLASFGIDKPWVEEGLKPDTFRYSDFYLYGQRRHNAFTEEMESSWLGAKGDLFDRIADDCDGIVASLYENYRCCQPRYADKLHFIPFPIKPTPNPTTHKRSDLKPTSEATQSPQAKQPITFFIGIQRTRSAYKGTDIMLRALERLQARHPEQMEVVKAENIPFAQYRKLLDQSHILLDQLYSYTPAMNALQAMSQGLVVVGGAEPEHYALLGEKDLRPIINVQPTEDDIVKQIETLLLAHPDNVSRLSHDSITYIHRHHDYIRVAEQYLRMWKKS